MSNEKTVINPVMQRWLRAPESLAPSVDCDGCTMSLNDPANARRWHSLKCCAFQPYVANFYCGAMLEAGLSPLPRDQGKAMLQPIGVVPTPQFRQMIHTTADPQREEKHLCTFYDLESRRCGIWRFRPGECSLYYCGSDVKREARAVWSRKVFQVESDLAQMALAHLGFGPATIAEQVDCLNGGDVPPMGKERALEIYRASWAWAKTQSEQDVQSWRTFDKAQSGE